MGIRSTKRLNQILDEHGFDAFVEALCAALLRGHAGPPESDARARTSGCC